MRGDVRRTTAYLGVLVAIVGFEVWLADLGPVLLFIAYSHIWFFATSRLVGALWSVALTVVFAAAIVLREGLEAGEREIREFAAARLADFKVPRKLIFLDEIPKGATGKLQRIGLAEKLGLG